MSEEQSRTVDRRRLLRRAGTVAAGLAGTAAVGSATAGPAQAAPGDPVLQGQANDAGSATTLSASSMESATLRLVNTATADEYGNTMAGPALRLTPSGDIISNQAEVGSIAMDQAGTIWAVTGEAADGFKYRDYVRTNFNSNTTVPIVPQRALDTRTSGGRARVLNPSGNFDSSGRLLAGKTIHLNLEDFVNFGDAVHGNVTVTGPLASGFLQVFPYGVPRPTSFSTINFQTNQTLSNAFLSGLGSGYDRVSIYTLKTTHVILDMVAFVISMGQVNPRFLSGAAGLTEEDRRARFAERAEPSWTR
ncbi:hypothetical protein AB0K04_14060 [Micromonospora coxensis]|uniref:hypothetical protein n=1 Tax=Micromonospora coxensis TaxID=356852 RepID=UPI00344599EE